MPLRLINLALRALKGRHRSKAEEHRRQDRLHTRVLAKDAVLAQDSTHIGNVRDRRAWAEVQKDLGTLKGKAVGKGQPLNAMAMIRHLRRLKAAQRLPLVLMTDNAPPCRCWAVQAWLQANKVIHLKSRPRTPTDNAGVERIIGEAKRISGLGKGRRLRGRQEGVKHLAKALKVLNEAWPRQSRGGHTAKELEQLLPHWRRAVSRQAFYAAVQRNIQRRTRGLKGRALGQATREAIYRTLERFKLVVRWRGPGVPARAESWKRG